MTGPKPDALDVDTIEARANAATPGPWKERESIWCGSFAVEGPFGFDMNQTERRKPYILLDSPSDATFIAHAREDIPALVGEVRRLREREAKLRELHAPVPIYQECGHEHEEGEPGGVFVSTIGLTCNYRYDVCNACCISPSAQYDDEPFLEICEEHRHRPDTPICKTREILDA